MAARAADIMRWFPATQYYRNHTDRLTWALGRLPAQPSGFRCLSIGSWGAEVPYLVSQLGAAEVHCIRGPVPGAPRVETRRVRAPGDLGTFEVTLHAFDIEREPLDPGLHGSFDLVLAWEVLEHLSHDPPHLVWQAALALKRGGLVSITTPNALWHLYTVAQLYGQNPLGLRLQPHRPLATHWRLYSPAEVADLCASTGCAVEDVTSFLNAEPGSWRSRLFLSGLRLLRRGSKNGACSHGQFVHVLARRTGDVTAYRPDWLFPKTEDTQGKPDLV